MPAEAIAPPPAAASAPVAAHPPALTPKDLTIPAPSTPPRQGSARERMLKETSKRWSADDQAPAPPVKPAETPEPTKPGDPPKPADAHEPAARPGDEPPADVPADQKKQSPWKLLRAEKEKAAALERQIAEAKTASLAESEKQEYLSRIEKMEAKVKAYEDEMRFRAYEKSPDFQKEYEEPYNQAWQRHMDDLKGVTITGEDGVARAMEAKDLLDLVNLDLPNARDLADAKWGKFAGDAMAARKEIRALFDSRIKALDEARKSGAEREKQMTERQQRVQKQTNAYIKATWDVANQAALADPNNGEYFKPVEGDETRNQLLGKGFALVDKAFSQNPTDPRFTPEQRAEVVRRHAAVRNRAAAFGPMKYIIAKLRKQLAELEKANGQFKDSQPPAAGGTDRNAPAGPLTGRAKMEAVRQKWERG
ncbi:MAG: hypothetical protein LV481_05730 [Methylacidiphilales bacterium]|nr:hypothetical protein [Candidatus Methylacidiphilales bacterium]